jgi:hypothetical protein
LTLAKQTEVVAVQVQWVGCEELILDDEIDPCILLRNDGNVLGGVECGVGASAYVCCLGELLKSWEARVDVHGVAVQVPAEDGTIVGGGNGAKLTSRDSRSLSRESAGRTGGNSDDGDEFREGLVLADTCNVTRCEAGARGWESIRSTTVLDDTVCKTEGSVVASRWASTLGSGTEEIRANGLIRLENDIVTLAKRDIDKVSLVWLDGDKVRSCEDSQFWASKSLIQG